MAMTSYIANTVADPRTKLQALSLMNECYKYKMDLTTGGVIVTDAIKFVQTNKEKLTVSISQKDDSKESEEPDYDEDNDQLEESQEEETEEKATTNTTF